MEMLVGLAVMALVPAYFILQVLMLVRYSSYAGIWVTRDVRRRDDLAFQ